MFNTNQPPIPKAATPIKDHTMKATELLQRLSLGALLVLAEAAEKSEHDIGRWLGLVAQREIDLRDGNEAQPIPPLEIVDAGAAARWLDAGSTELTAGATASGDTDLIAVAVLFDHLARLIEQQAADIH